MRLSKTSLTTVIFALAAISAKGAAPDRVIVLFDEDITISTDISNQDWTGPHPGGDTGGAVENFGTVTVASGLSFSDNRANSGGAIYSSTDSTQGYPPSHVAIQDGVSFTRNIAVDDAGGAIYVMGVGIASTLSVSDNVSFNGNESGGSGGAAFLQGATTTIGNDAEFIGNIAGSSGGAILNFDTGGGISSAAIGTGALFSGNTAARWGGAIYNNNSMTIGAGAEFYDNSAGLLGGAIYNETGASLAFDGDVTFSNNMVAGVLNDIYNAGTLHFANGGTVTLDGGIASGAGSSIIFDANTTLIARLNITPTISADTITIGSGSTVSSLIIDIGVRGDNLELWEIANATGTFAYTGPASNALYNIAQNADGTFNVSQHTLNVPGADAGQLAIIAGLMSGASANNDFNEIANNITALLQTGNSLDTAAGLAAASAFGPTTAPQAQVVSQQNALQVFDAVGTRLSGMAAAPRGQSSGDFEVGGTAVWVQGLANAARLNGYNGFDANSLGVAAGAETNLTSSTKLGIGYAYTHTEVEPTIGETKINSNTILAYGEYKPTEWFLNGVVSNTFGMYSDNKTITGVEVHSSHKVDTFAAQGLTGYEIGAADFVVTPQAGLRYFNVRERGYTDSTNSRIDGHTFDYLTGIAGFKLSYEKHRQAYYGGGVARSGSRCVPELYVGATYDMITSDVNATMAMANGAVVNVNGSALARTAVEAGAGLTATFGSLDATIAYIGRFRESYMDNTGLLSFKYKF
ncbi:MAG: autotransporter domain-containing protein [Alphaproteobacteria bacterium]|nr:autotransporter domain-containing protein [Alphaproteobacteria bacterium]